MAGDLGAGQRERVRRNSLLRVTIMITALFIIIGKPAVRARGIVRFAAHNLCREWILDTAAQGELEGGRHCFFH